MKTTHTLRDGTQIEIGVIIYCGRALASTRVRGAHIQGDVQSPAEMPAHIQRSMRDAGYDGMWRLGTLCLTPEKGHEIRAMIRAAQDAHDATTEAKIIKRRDARARLCAAIQSWEDEAIRRVIAAHETGEGDGMYFHAGDDAVAHAAKARAELVAFDAAHPDVRKSIESN